MAKMFVSYSHEDSQWVVGFPGASAYELPFVPWLSKQLLDINVEVWCDPDLRREPGESFERIILEKIDDSDFALLLLSHDFFRSDFIRDIELPRMRARAEKGKLRLIPLLVAPVIWDWNSESKWFRSSQILPNNTHPLINTVSNLAEWKRVRTEITGNIRDKVLSVLGKHDTRLTTEPGPKLDNQSPGVIVPDAGYIQNIDLGLDVNITMAWIPAGSFTMGNSSGQSNEQPPHEVELSSGYWISTTPITQLQWTRIVGENPSAFQNAQNPVEQVSWKDITRIFLPTLNRLTNKSFRLPSESQWEYACAASCSAAMPPRGAWQSSNSRNQTQPVARLKPNAWGLYDMCGNVWEWCEDWYSAYSAGDVVDPVGPSDGTMKVLRGGCWYDVPSLCRCSSRFGASPATRDHGIGFRVVLPG